MHICIGEITKMNQVDIKEIKRWKQRKGPK